MGSLWKTLTCCLAFFQMAVCQSSTYLGHCPTNISEICSNRKANCHLSPAPYEATIQEDLLHVECFHEAGPREITCVIPISEECRDDHVTCVNTPDYVTQCDRGCHDTFYRCEEGTSGKCAPRSTLCNRVLDPDGCGASNGEEFTDGVGFKCLRNKVMCVLPKNLVGDNVKDCDDGGDERDDSFYFECIDKSMKIHKSGVCDDVFDCPDFSDECVCMREVLPCQCLVLLGKNATDCRRSDDDGKCEIDQTSHTCNAFRNETKVIRNCTVCDFNFDCPAGDDERDCNGRHYCAPGSKPPFVRNYQVNDGRMDCRDGSDECLVVPGSNTLMFHDRQDLVGNVVLIILVWMILVVALVGNLIVLIQQIRILRSMRFQHDALASLRANHLLVLSLTIANLLMVVYLACLGISYEALRGSFCRQEQVWRSSQTCTGMGILVVLSTETSVQTLVALSVVRLYSVLKPYSTSKQPKLKLLLPFILFTWLVSAIIAWFPLSPVYQQAVPDTVWIPDNPFLQNAETNLTTAKAFLYRYTEVFWNSDPAFRKAKTDEITKATDWKELETIFSRLDGKPVHFDIAARFNYYNIHSVCIPNIFPRPTSAHLGFSLFVTNFNVFAFICVAALYVTIYVKTMLGTTAYLRGADAASMQWKVFRITAINFCCWIPVYLLSYLKAFGVTLSGDAYAVAAVILLPMNCAVSPLLYSNAVPAFIRYIKSYFAKFSDQPLRRKSVEMTEL